MKQDCVSRRGFITAAGAALGAAVLAAGHTNAAASSPQAGTRGDGRFRYCLNTSTIRGQKLGLAREIDVAAQAGYTAIEPWIQTIQDYVKAGGQLGDIRKQIADGGLTVEGAISFARWVADDDTIRAEAIEQVKREMDLLAQIGGRRIAAPPAGANSPNAPALDLEKAAERYRVLLDLGDRMGIVPALELWGPSRNLHRLGECMFVVIESGHPKAALLGDVYHIYKGGSDFHGLKMISATAMPVLHMNDYPADPPRDKISDRDRVMPGDGIAPLSQILRDLHDKGGATVLSLELFSQAYWEKDALEVAKTGLAKMRTAVQKALVGV
ncbi:MAG: sugar phosphate isomerase/epimerase [Planctomycetes bacterium]|jgi:sugar phosphate isomerase/epimerase|nr:sugar phosphate isomerase/epimerase [Planctomycetota bacterium]